LRDASPLGQIDHPEESLQRLVTRELDLDEALRQNRGLEWRIYRGLAGGGGGRPTGEARGGSDALPDAIDSDAIELRRAILLGESGEMDRLEERISRWKEDGGTGGRTAGVRRGRDPGV